MEFAIRPYHPTDLYSLYTICLRTADSGRDASPLYRDPELMGHLFAAPYAVAEPELCFILTADGTPSGYVLGTRDTLAFTRWCATEWFPALRARYPLPAPDDVSPDARAIRDIHRGEPGHAEIIADYPAHLHIDILPVGQGQGLGPPHDGDLSRPPARAGRAGRAPGRRQAQPRRRPVLRAHGLCPRHRRRHVDWLRHAAGRVGAVCDRTFPIYSERQLKPCGHRPHLRLGGSVAIQAATFLGAPA